MYAVPLFVELFFCCLNISPNTTMPPDDKLQFFTTSPRLIVTHTQSAQKQRRTSPGEQDKHPFTGCHLLKEKTSAPEEEAKVSLPFGQGRIGRWWRWGVTVGRSASVRKSVAFPCFRWLCVFLLEGKTREWVY